MNRLAIVPRSLLRTGLRRLAVTPSRPHLVLPLLTRAAFSTTPIPAAKKKASREAAVASAAEDAPTAEVIDFDAQFDKLESDIARIADRLKDDLSKLRAGRADPSILEGLDVVVDKAQGDAVPLRDVAHVVTKGRGLAVTVYEAANVKRVVSAIQIADLNLQPVVDAKNPQLVNVPLPPPTRDSRDAMVKQSKDVGHKALDALKNARLATHKKIQATKKTVRPDDLKKADKKMEDIVKKRKAELEAVIAAAQKGIMEA
ncbi:ribosome recycling factor-domain-containing protein [Tricharina praecox]|uniref:ribosome recycling factor-domain-containing protein n=1 Tax=Tricharina praecox TaxID=43433 RepID=UPI002220F17F|nr:ribosome recycling factor-domain-containing protein [Tricharina praecox]KAI5846873.1 ribosome recycling factor-domain-containing protein [Tricharina praecox]